VLFYFLVAQFRGVMCDKSCLLIACGILSRSYLIAQLQDSAQMTSWNGLPQYRQKEIMARVIFTEYCDRPIPKRGRTESRRSSSSSGTRLRAFSPHSQTSDHSVKRDSPGGSQTGIVPLNLHDAQLWTGANYWLSWNRSHCATCGTSSSLGHLDWNL